MASSIPSPSSLLDAQVYFPKDVVIPNYIQNDMSVLHMIAIFFAIWGAVMSVGVFSARVANPDLSRTSLLVVSWLILCAFVHTFFEGYYSLNIFTIAGNSDLFGQLWKEYSQADSRYLTPNSFVWCMETFTSFVTGPLCVYAAYTVVTDSPLRHPVQLVISFGQLYGTYLYFATAEFEKYVNGIVYTRPEPYYVYFYYLFMNITWIVVPAALIYQSVAAIKAAFIVADTAAKSKKKQ